MLCNASRPFSDKIERKKRGKQFRHVSRLWVYRTYNSDVGLFFLFSTVGKNTLLYCLKKKKVVYWSRLNLKEICVKDSKTIDYTEDGCFILWAVVLRPSRAKKSVQFKNRILKKSANKWYNGYRWLHLYKNGIVLLNSLSEKEPFTDDDGGRMGAHLTAIPLLTQWGRTNNI